MRYYFFSQQQFNEIMWKRFYRTEYQHLTQDEVQVCDCWHRYSEISDNNHSDFKDAILVAQSETKLNTRTTHYKG